MTEEERMQEIRIKEFLEVLEVVRLVAVETAKGIKEDRAVAAALALLTNPTFHAKLRTAIDDIERVPAEVIDINGREGFKIAAKLIEIGDEVMEVLAA